MQQEMAREWVVMKFGGTSVSSADCWNTICSQVNRNLEEGKRVLVVVSALSGVTNLLTRLVADTVPEDMDSLLSDLKSRHLSLLSELGLEVSGEFEPAGTTWPVCSMAEVPACHLNQQPWSWLTANCCRARSGNRRCWPPGWNRTGRMPATCCVLPPSLRRGACRAL